MKLLRVENFDAFLTHKWWAAWETVKQHNHNRVNVFAAATVFVYALFYPDEVKALANEELLLSPTRSLPQMSKKDLDWMRSTIVRKFQGMKIPLHSPYTLATLESLTWFGPTRLWMFGGITHSLHHTLPRSLFDDMLPESQEHLHQLHNSGVIQVQEKVGAYRFGIEAHADKIAELLNIVDDVYSQGCRSVVIVDANEEYLKQADALLTPVFNLPIHLVLVRQNSRKKDAVLLSSSLIHYYYQVESFDEVPLLITSQIMTLKPAILCGFEGVITNETQAKTIQEHIIISTIQEAIERARGYGQSASLNKPRLAPM